MVGLQPVPQHPGEDGGAGEKAEEGAVGGAGGRAGGGGSAGARQTRRAFGRRRAAGGALAETNDLLNTTQMLQPQTGGGAGKSWDETLTELASDIAERIPGPYDIEVALLDFPVLYEEVRTTFRWTTACAVFYCFFIYLQLRLS